MTDGDTITVLDGSRVERKVRLSGIDAPEKKQAFGEVSKQNLAWFLFGKHVTVEWYGQHRKRLIGRVVVGGHDASLRQIQDGMAWHFKRYQRQQTLSHRVSYAAAEEQARVARRGLWRDPQPVPPWEFRNRRKRIVAAH